MYQTTNQICMLTINEAADRIPGLSRHHVRQMCISGELPCVMAGRKYLICEQVLIDHLTKPRTPTPPEVSAGGIRRIEA